MPRCSLAAIKPLYSAALLYDENLWRDPGKLTLERDWREGAGTRLGLKPKLQPVRRAIPGLTCCFAGLVWWCSGYFKVSGIAAPMSSKACRWALVGSASIGTVAVVPVNRTWLRVRVARWSSRPRKL